MSVQYFTDDTPFDLKNREQISQWLSDACENEGTQLQSLKCIFCSDSRLHEMNVEYLNHDTLTDIITFDMSDNQLITGELYISVDRVEENAKSRKISFPDELHRVLIHGVLHLLGYNDKSESEIKEIRSKEDYYLNLRPFS